MNIKSVFGMIVVLYGASIVGKVVRVLSLQTNKSDQLNIQNSKFQDVDPLKADDKNLVWFIQVRFI